MIEIWRRAWLCYRSLFPLALIFAALATFAQNTMSHPQAAMTVPLILFAMQANRHFLFGETWRGRRPPAPAYRPGRFIGVSLLLIGVPAGLVLGVMLLLPASLSRNMLLLVGLGTMGVLYLLALGLFGTLLPQAVLRDPRYR
jgi:hypothetical protein